MLRRTDETRPGFSFSAGNLFANTKGTVGQDALDAGFLASSCRPLFDKTRIATKGRKGNRQNKY